MLDALDHTYTLVTTKDASDADSDIAKMATFYVGLSDDELVAEARGVVGRDDLDLTETKLLNIIWAARKAGNLAADLNLVASGAIDPQGDDAPTLGDLLTEVAAIGNGIVAAYRDFQTD
jgi:hypothetical protein